MFPLSSISSSQRKRGIFLDFLDLRGMSLAMQAQQQQPLVNVQLAKDKMGEHVVVQLVRCSLSELKRLSPCFLEGIGCEHRG